MAPWPPPVTGLLLNVAGIVFGGVAGLTFAGQLSAARQRNLKILLGAFTVYAGLQMTWNAVGGTPAQVLKQLGIAMLALSLGNLTGALLHIQRGANALGKIAGDRLREAQSGKAGSPMQGILAATILACVSPLAIVGALQEGFTGDWRPLALKAGVDALATLGLATIFRWPVLLSAIPVLLYQGALEWIARAGLPHIGDPNLIDAFSAVGGLIVASSALIILDLRKIALANLLPALLYAPVLTAWWR